MANKQDLQTAVAAEVKEPTPIEAKVLPYVTEVGAYDIIKNNQEDKDKLGQMKSKVTMVSARADFDKIYAEKFPEPEKTPAEKEDGPADGTADGTVEIPSKDPVKDTEVKTEPVETKPAAAPKAKSTKVKSTPANTAGIGNPSAPAGVSDAGISVEDK